MDGDMAVSEDRVLTIPNLISFARLLCVPLFLWLVFGVERKVAAAGLLAVLGATDWVDGWIARRFHQVSALGKILDPTADRIMLAVAVVAIAVEGSIPGLVLWPVIVREIAISAAVLVLAAVGAARIDVLWAGKAGTFALMVAFPLYLLAGATEGSDALIRFVAWGWAVPGMLLSYYAAYAYARAVPAALAARNADRGEGVTT